MKSVSEQASRRNVFYSLGIFQFLTFVRRGVFYTFMINYLFTLMPAVTLTATLGTLNMISSALGQNLLWGKISDRYKLRSKLIIMGESIAGLTYLGVFLLHRSLRDSGDSFAAGLAIIFGLSLLEFFWSMSDVGWATLLTDVTTLKTRGTVVGILNFVASLARMVGIVSAGLLYDEGNGFRQGTIFYIVIAMLFTGATMMWLISRSAKQTAPIEDTSSDEKNRDLEGRDDLTHKNESTHRWFLISLIIIVMGASSISQVFLLFLKLEGGLNATDLEMSFILTAWTAGGMVSLLSGRLADKFGRAVVILFGVFLAALTPVFYGLASSVPVISLAYGVNGISFWTIQTVGFALVADLTPIERRGQLLSRYNAVMALSWGPAGLLIGGPLADFQTSLGFSAQAAYINCFLVSSLIVGFGAVVFYLKVMRNLKVR
jgi:MFS family permease